MNAKQVLQKMFLDYPGIYMTIETETTLGSGGDITTEYKGYIASTKWNRSGFTKSHTTLKPVVKEMLERLEGVHHG